MKRLNILLIEDDQWLADSYAAMLSAAGFKTQTVTSAHVAMKLIDKQMPALIVADVMLGDHNTFTLFHELQSYEDTASIPVILCTGVDTQQLSSSDMKSYGIVQVFSKATLTPDQLVMAVQEHIDRDGKVTR
jgi:DNA-binding response OmpR family regulator